MHLPLQPMNYIKNIVLLFFIVFTFLSHAYAESEVSEGYDENTELTVKGSIKDTLRGLRGPIVIIIQSGIKDYNVITAPPWYLAQQRIELKSGSFYEVTGSKYVAKDGTTYIIASNLKDLSTGKIFRLRDSACMPLWKGQRMRRGMNHDNVP